MCVCVCVCVCVFKREKDGFKSQRITVSLTSPIHLSFVLWRCTSPILMVKLDWPWPSCIFKVTDGLFPRNGFLKYMIREAERRTGKSLWFLLASWWFQLREKLKLPLSFTKSSHCHLRHHKSFLADHIFTSPPNTGYNNIHDELMAESPTALKKHSIIDVDCIFYFYISSNWSWLYFSEGWPIFFQALE